MFREVKKMQSQMMLRRETYEGSGKKTYSRIAKSTHIRSQVISDAIKSSWQSESTNQQDDEKAVGKEGCEVDNFSSPANTLPDAEVAYDPNDGQSCCQLRSNASVIIESCSDLKSLSFPELFDRGFHSRCVHETLFLRSICGQGTLTIIGCQFVFRFTKIRVPRIVTRSPGDIRSITQ